MLKISRPSVGMKLPTKLIVGWDWIARLMLLMRMVWYRRVPTKACNQQPGNSKTVKYFWDFPSVCFSRLDKHLTRFHTSTQIKCFLLRIIHTRAWESHLNFSRTCRIRWVSYKNRSVNCIWWSFIQSLNNIYFYAIIASSTFAC